MSQQSLDALLDQYAQEAGFENMLDLKRSYTPQAYGWAFQTFVRRARAELDAKEA